MTTTESDQESAGQGVVVVAQSAVTASNAVRAIDLTGGRLIRRVEWHEALSFLEAQVERPVILLETAEVPKERLTRTLCGIAPSRQRAILT